MDEPTSVSVSQLALVLAAVVVGAVLLKTLWVDHGATPSSAVTGAVKSDVSAESPSTASGQARAESEAVAVLPEGKPLPVRVLYASSLGTAKGTCCYFRRELPFAVPTWRFVGQGTVLGETLLGAFGSFFRHCNTLKLK